MTHTKTDKITNLAEVRLKSVFKFHPQVNQNRLLGWPCCTLSCYGGPLAVAFAFIALTLAGCSVMTIYPQPESGFTPKIDYPVSYDDAWESVLEVLAIERAGTVYQSKDKGRIISGFFTGAKEGSEAQNKSRWSYVITVVQLNTNTTRILLESKVEQKLKGWGYTYSWRDVTNHPGVKKNVADGLDKWLYEKIEAQLRVYRLQSGGRSDKNKSSRPSFGPMNPGNYK